MRARASRNLANAAISLAGALTAFALARFDENKACADVMADGEAEYSNLLSELLGPATLISGRVVM
jgi:hypothetical protein